MNTILFYSLIIRQSFRRNDKNIYSPLFKATIFSIDIIKGEKEAIHRQLFPISEILLSTTEKLLCIKHEVTLLHVVIRNNLV